MPFYTKSHILDLLSKLSNLTVQVGRRRELYVYGGAALVLDTDIRDGACDIDAVTASLEDRGAFYRASCEISRTMPPMEAPWLDLHDAAILEPMIQNREVYFHPYEATVRSGFEAFNLFLLNDVPQLALKLVRWRPLERDYRDMRGLCERLACSTPQAFQGVWRAHVGLLPPSLTEHVTANTLEERWREIQKRPFRRIALVRPAGGELLP